MPKELKTNVLRKVSAFCLITLLAAVVGVGCAHQEPTPTPTPVESHVPGNQVSELPSGPDEKDGHINLEGSDEPFRFHRLHSTELGMVTYIPHDLVSEPVTAEDGDRVMIWAAFGGEKLENTYLSLHLFSPGTSGEEVNMERRNQLEAAGFTSQVMDDDERYPWAHAAYTYQGTEDGIDYTGIIVLGNHGERALLLEIRATTENIEGFYPRVQAVLEAMEWYGF